mmetsp:Transcript_88289/g.239031  ORF Transcript_88289/g.239031 Transcript_88289/m.239031 type:complete len:88 (+) Transcript_88289:28-291(+)
MHNRRKPTNTHNLSRHGGMLTCNTLNRLSDEALRLHEIRKRLLHIEGADWSFTAGEDQVKTPLLVKCGGPDVSSQVSQSGAVRQVAV